MAHASSLGPALALALAACLLSAATAAADERASLVDPDASQDLLDAVPAHCAPFAEVTSGEPGARPSSEHAWRQLLSLAACVQDASIEAAPAAGGLEAMVDRMSERLTLPMLIYLDALEHADAPIQLRAAFQIGMAYVALATRARGSIPAPPDLADEAAARRYRELHARLEPLLVPARRAAWISFQAIDEAAAVDAALLADEVGRHMVCTARRMLPALRDAAPERTLLVRGAACGEAPVQVTTAAR